MQNMPNVGLYGRDMHDFILTEAELGTRAAQFADLEGYQPGWFVSDAHYRADLSPAPGPVAERGNHEAGS
jgi:hypothetical protein